MPMLHLQYPRALQCHDKSKIIWTFSLSFDLFLLNLSLPIHISPT